MKTLGSIASALVGVVFGMIALGIVSPKNPGHPAVFLGFAGAGALLGVIAVPPLARWIYGAFAGK